MSLEKTNTKITINGVLNISDYERKLRSSNNHRKLYRGDLLNYIQNKELDPIVREKVLAETAKIPCQAINHVFPRLDDLIRKIEREVNLERNSIAETIVIPDTSSNSIDIADLYNQIANVSEESEDSLPEIHQTVQEEVQVEENSLADPEN